jgi:hypothetical protein
MLSMAAYGCSIAFLGRILSGLPGAIVILVLFAMLAYAAWGLYKLDKKAWWVAVIVIAGWSVSWILSYTKENMQLMYEKMHFSAQQLSMIEQNSMFFGPAMRWFCGFGLIVVLGYFVYIRKYFDLKQP